ncbi:hypothetical protein BGLA2_700008 [Burkholderia gladioli]|nr:hypothetical protein BGLA2_700008 [Burkholderia gladioli]
MTSRGAGQAKALDLHAGCMLNHIDEEQRGGSIFSVALSEERIIESLRCPHR